MSYFRLTFLSLERIKPFHSFVFDETSFELKNVDLGASDEDALTESGENFVVGGANRWTYDSFVNWDFFPSVDYPVLVYFKESQTPQVRSQCAMFLFFFFFFYTFLLRTEEYTFISWLSSLNE